MYNSLYFTEGKYLHNLEELILHLRDSDIDDDDDNDFDNLYLVNAVHMK
jgi:hypothetical protein